MVRRSAEVNQNGNGILVFPISCKGIANFATGKNVTEGELSGLLEDFYCSAKKQVKSEYKPARMIAARGAFQQHQNSLERGISL